MIHTDVTLKADGVYAIKTPKAGEVEEKLVSNYINIVSHQVNLESEEYFVELEFKPINSDKLATIRVKVSDIASSSSILKLAAYGVDINDMNKTYLVKHLRNCREQAPYIYNHQSLGFKRCKNNDEELQFYHHQVVGFEHLSEYVGPFNIQPSGSAEIYFEMIERDILGFTPLEFGLVLGASSAVIGLLGERYSIESLLVHLVGDSSSGKTTVAMLATSLWGSPTLAANGLLSSWNATKNALQMKLANNFGVVMCFDEVSQYTGSDATQVMYSLAEGTSRSRLDKNSQMRTGVQWRTTILSTGERSLIDLGNQNTGLRVRTLELEMKQWTRNAENSNQIKRIISQNHSMLGLMFVEHMISLGLKSLCNLFEECEEYIVEKLPASPLRERLASKLAILLMTSMLLENMGIGINVDNIERLLLKQFSQIGVEADLGIKAYEQLMQYLSSNQSKFICQYARRGTSGVYDYSPSHCQGRIKFDSNNQMEEVAINAKEFKSIISSLGFESERVVLKNWKEKGWLDYEENKLQKRLIINNTRISCIVLKVGLIERYLKEMELRGC